MEDYLGLSVNSIDDVDQILDQLVLTVSGCPSSSDPGNPCDANVCDACSKNGNYVSDDETTYCCVGKHACIEKLKTLKGRNLCCKGEEACLLAQFNDNNDTRFKYKSVECKGKGACRKAEFLSYDGGTGPLGMCCDGYNACKEIGRFGGTPGGSRIQCGIGSSQNGDNLQSCYKSSFITGSSSTSEICCSAGQDACLDLRGDCATNKKLSWCKESSQDQHRICT